jgi:hypothetical protein
MKKIIFLLSSAIIFTLLLSCKSFWNRNENSKSWFIDSILHHPDNINSIIDKSKYYDVEMRKTTLQDDTLKSYIQYIKNLSQNGYDYTYYLCYPNQSWDPDINNVSFWEEIKVKGKGNNLYINFYFQTKNNKWILTNIDRWEKTGFERLKEFPGNP